MTTTLALTDTQFREMFRAFVDRDTYPDVAITMYLTLGTTALDSNLWQDQWPLGVALFTAHYLTLDWQAARQAETGAPATGSTGPISSKSVGGASVSFDTGLGGEPGGGHWNLTVWGRRLLHSAQLVGMGGAQLGGGVPSPGNWFPGSAAWYVN